ncbi:MAG: WYL domain-containing protein [Cyanobacteria bacterium P01_A01_bin.37]
MVKKPALHPYSDRPSFERLMLLIATFIEYPGIGCADPNHSSSEGDHHQALEEVCDRLQDTAKAYGIELPAYSLPTIRKDVGVLRQYGILERRMYRWGYYLGTGALQKDELRLAIQALQSQAHHQGDPTARRVCERLELRLRGLNLETKGHLFFPVRSHLNRVIVHTDPEEMMQRGQYRKTLFHQLDVIENAIAQGQRIEIYRQREPYHTMDIGHMTVYPMQLIYSDIAWYLLYEYVENGHFEVERLDRLSNSVTIVDANGRGTDTQLKRLTIAHQLLTQGWGLYLGNPEEQQQEKAGKLGLTKVIVRFFPPAVDFILEGECRHPTQKIRKSRNTDNQYIDYIVELPGRSLNEFCRWVYRFMQAAKILAPSELSDKHYQAALGVVQSYEHI